MSRSVAERNLPPSRRWARRRILWRKAGTLTLYAAWSESLRELRRSPRSSIVAPKSNGLSRSLGYRMYNTDPIESSRRRGARRCHSTKARQIQECADMSINGAPALFRRPVRSATLAATRSAGWRAGSQNGVPIDVAVREIAKRTELLCHPG